MCCCCYTNMRQHLYVGRSSESDFGAVCLEGADVDGHLVFTAEAVLAAGGRIEAERAASPESYSPSPSEPEWRPRLRSPSQQPALSRSRSPSRRPDPVVRIPPRPPAARRRPQTAFARPPATANRGGEDRPAPNRPATRRRRPTHRGHRGGAARGESAAPGPAAPSAASPFLGLQGSPPARSPFTASPFSAGGPRSSPFAAQTPVSPFLTQPVPQSLPPWWRAGRAFLSD